MWYPQLGRCHKAALISELNNDCCGIGVALWLRRYFFALCFLDQAILECVFHVLGAELPENAGTAVVDVHHLVSLPVKALRGIYHDPGNEFVDQLRREAFGNDRSSPG